jgi:ATP-dependent Clp protease ATP-binding subunit ClpC
VIKAGGAEGAIDASNILKPYLARGEIQLIGATTFEEFNDSFEKDKALKRRFQIIDVNEPSIAEVNNILLKIKPIYEDYYNITIDDELLSLIVDFSNEYILNQRFPDKAIELPSL